MTGRESAASSDGETPRALDARAPIIEPFKGFIKILFEKYTIDIFNLIITLWRKI